jgi:hypothetical protein
MHYSGSKGERNRGSRSIPNGLILSGSRCNRISGHYGLECVHRGILRPPDAEIQPDVPPGGAPNRLNPSNSRSNRVSGHYAVEDGSFRYVGSIRLHNSCLKCHVPFCQSLETRLAALSISIPEVKK